MKFGIFYEHQLPQPWGEDAELRLYQQALDQIELADRIGIDYVWEVEHHFSEEYSHSSAPEVFLAACSQRTKRIRLGHGITLMPPLYNHPARVAERIATLDLVSNGRVDWGTGESATAVEMGGFGVDPQEKEAMWQEATEQAANMLAMRPYPGFRGRWFDMPCRNLVPKSVQKPHPPIWVACSRRETIHRAARNGVGALAFAFLEPEQAGKWVEEYYGIIKSKDCVPIGHSVNPNIAIVTGMSCHPEEAEAVRARRLQVLWLLARLLRGIRRAQAGAGRPLAAVFAGQGPAARECRARRHRHPCPIARAFEPLRESRHRPGHVRAAERRQSPRTHLRVARDFFIKGHARVQRARGGPGGGETT
jgi:alkanesulfonate monooxygenase SsuD/methylene tetrahydromethanopterin reductase-like flavin-dependent oxidoreductase (luciferase family)